MDPWIAAVAGLGIGGAIGIATRLITVWDRMARLRIETDAETQRMKTAWYQQMQQAKTGKGSKKNRTSKGGQEPDDVDALAEALQPFRPLLSGLAASRNLPIDVDAFLDGDPVAHDQVGMWLEQQMSRAAKGQPPQLTSADGTRDYWTEAGLRA